MFSGIGGFEQGIKQATNDSWECIGYSEINKYACQIYDKHFNHKNYGDATKINPKELPDFSLLVGGFPCQAFSIAGKRLGFEDTRGTLFFDIARILEEKKPKYLLLENVKGLLSHDGGRTFQTIVRILTDIGYRVEWQVLNSKDFGVPQNRERIYIVGYLREERRPKVFPIKRKNSKALVRGEVVGTLQAGYAKGDRTGGYVIKEESQGNRVYKTQGLSTTLASNSGGLGSKTGLYAVSDRHSVYDGLSIRKLTPVECERLQGFPDNWTKSVSNTQRYKALGNAVTVNVIEYIITFLI